jgi:hypothetical protein
MKNLKTLENENLLKSKSYGWDKDKFWYLAKHPLNEDQGFTPPKAEIHRYKYEHEKDCGDIFVSLALTGNLLLWEGEGRAIKGFRHDRKFLLDDLDWYLENERGTQAPTVLRGKLEQYLKHYRETKKMFHVLFVVQDEDSVKQMVYLFEEYKLPNFYWATVFDEFVFDPLQAIITSRNQSNTLSNTLSNSIES